MVRHRRSTRWFWFLLVVLVVGLYYGIVAASTIDHCGRDAPRYWNWVPPRWECTRTP